jgi:hypothetical protein
MDWTFYFAGQQGKLLSIRNVESPAIVTFRYKSKIHRDYLIELKFTDGTKKVIDLSRGLQYQFSDL